MIFLRSRCISTMDFHKIAECVSTIATIVKVKGKNQWYIKSEPGKKYNSRAKAEARLKQIHTFEHMDPKKKGKKRKSFVVVAARIAGANIYERLSQIDDAIERAEEDESCRDELEKLRDERAEILDAIECEQENG